MLKRHIWGNTGGFFHLSLGDPELAQGHGSHVLKADFRMNPEHVTEIWGGGPLEQCDNFGF